MQKNEKDKRVLQTFELVENQDGERYIEKTETGQRFAFYKVQLFNDKIFYVFAESPEGAISQASCERDEDIDTNGALVVKLPFKIRGWSSRLFS